MKFNVDLMCQKAQEMVKNLEKIEQLEKQNKEIGNFMLQLLPSGLGGDKIDGQYPLHEYDYGSFYSIDTPYFWLYHLVLDTIDQKNRLLKFIKSDFRRLRLKIKEYKNYKNGIPAKDGFIDEAHYGS